MEINSALSQCKWSHWSWWGAEPTKQFSYSQVSLEIIWPLESNTGPHLGRWVVRLLKGKPGGNSPLQNRADTHIVRKCYILKGHRAGKGKPSHRSFHLIYGGPQLIIIIIIIPWSSHLIWKGSFHLVLGTSIGKGPGNFVSILSGKLHHPLRGQTGTRCVVSASRLASPGLHGRRVGIKAVRVGCRSHCSHPASLGSVCLCRSWAELSLLWSTSIKRELKRKLSWF